MYLKLTNNTTKLTLTYDVRDWFSSNIFFHFNLKLENNFEGIKIEDIPEGEYSYELREYAVTPIIAEGLLQIGDYVRENKEYNNEKKYKVYGK